MKYLHEQILNTQVCKVLIISYYKTSQAKLLLYKVYMELKIHKNNFLQDSAVHTYCPNISFLYIYFAEMPEKFKAVKWLCVMLPTTLTYASPLSYRDSQHPGPQQGSFRTTAKQITPGPNAPSLKALMETKPEIFLSTI